MKITINDIQKFLKSQEYQWNGYCENFEQDQTKDNTYVFRKADHIDDVMRKFLPSLLLMGNADLWSMSRVKYSSRDGKVATKSCNNPFVYASRITPTEFKLFTVKEHVADDTENEVALIPHKDLTIAWARYLAVTYPEYISYIRRLRDEAIVKQRAKFLKEDELIQDAKSCLIKRELKNVNQYASVVNFFNNLYDEIINPENKRTTDII